MAKITVFQIGYCTHPECMAIKGGRYRSTCFPAMAYLIQTSQQLFLWDTGYSRHFMEAARGIYRLYPFITPIYFAGEEALIQQLAQIGVRPRDLTSIIVSHFHADHIAGLLDFPDVRIVCNKEAWASVQGMTGLRALSKAFLPQLINARIIANFTFLDALPQKKLSAELQPFRVGWDVTGTGEIMVVPLPGHAKGQIGAFVLEDRGWTLLAADAAWTVDNYIHLRGPSEFSFLIQDNRALYYDTLRKLHVLHSKGTINIQLTHQATKVLV